jgi:hypothetical protein
MDSEADTKTKMKKSNISDLLERIKKKDRSSLLKAKQEYTKTQFKTNYGLVFGRKPDQTDFKDMNILNVKKFSQIQA